MIRYSSRNGVGWKRISIYYMLLYMYLLSMCILVLFYILSSRHFDILRDQAFLENLIYFSFFFLRDFSSRMRKGVVKRKI